MIAFADGRPVDQFIGVLPEGQTRANSSTSSCRDGADAERRVSTRGRPWRRRPPRASTRGIASRARDRPGFRRSAPRPASRWLLGQQPYRRGARRGQSCCRRKRRKASTHASTRSRRSLDAAGCRGRTAPRPTRSKRASRAIPTIWKRVSSSPAALIAGRNYAGALEHLLAIVAARSRLPRRHRPQDDAVGFRYSAAHQPELVAQWRRKLSAAIINHAR